MAVAPPYQSFAHFVNRQVAKSAGALPIGLAEDAVQEASERQPTAFQRPHAHEKGGCAVTRASGRAEADSLLPTASAIEVALDPLYNP